jgi:cell division protein FtsN
MGVTFPQTLFGAGDKANGGHGKKLQSPASMRGAATDPDRTLAAAATAPVEALIAPGANPGPGQADEVAARAAPRRASPAEVVMTSKAEPAAQPAAKAPDAQAGAPPSAGSRITKSEAKAPKPVGIPVVAPGEKNKGRFALQLSSFPDKSEAEAFARKLEGERPYLVVSDIPGKGTWYRVRVGDYASAKDAMTAKQSFEKKHNVIAYIAQN